MDENIVLYADDNMLSTILRNLIGNAIKFTDKMGEITISLEQNINETLFTISDTGMGMSEDIIDKLFKIEEKVSIPDTESRTGTGLGLLLCKEFVEKHNGKIWVESKEGIGSHFKFNIPSDLNPNG